MKQGIRLGRRTALTIIMSSFAASITWILACAPPAPQAPPLPPPTYRFSYEPPQQSSRQIGVTLGLVRPFYEPISAGDTPTDWQQWPVVKDYLKTMGGDFQRMLVAKGFTLTGPFDDLNQMTYPDKQTANLTLTPKVFLNVERSVGTQRDPNLGELYGTGEGVLTVNTWIVFELLEPLSGEKMWVKKLALDPRQEPYTYRYKVYTETVNAQSSVRREGNKLRIEPLNALTGQQVRRIEVSNDNSQHALAQVLEASYATVMQTAWAYFNPSEVLNLKQMADGIRKNKRF